MKLQDIFDAVESYHPSPEKDLIQRAYDFAEKHHGGQHRASGVPYLNHLIETALLTCKLKLDIPSVVAALLHDVIEDTEVSREELTELFGSDVAEIVEGVTKLTRIEFASREEKQAESFRKMLIAMAKDIRVILVKLCDRLHNMRTLDHLSELKRRRIAQETRDIYAPLANRLGIDWMKSELEDLCLKYLRPNLFKAIDEKFERDTPETEKYIKTTAEELLKKLEAAGVSAQIKGRRKHYYSIWRKMELSNLSFDEVHDILGFRILVPTIRACYESLGVVHSAYKPVPGRFKDYIAMPKPNMYQSLHTTVIGPEGERVEIQIRTPEMDLVAEEGIAAHWRYKEGGSNPAFDLNWVKELVETQQYLKNPDEFIQSVKGELFPEEVFVFTPRGDLVRLPFEASPIDFAYAVHTDVGHRTTGAKVNGSIVPLSHKLENGDTVEVITANNRVPSKDWLDYVKSSKAKQRIRAFLKSQEHSRSMAIGMELLSKDLRKLKKSLKKFEKSGEILKLAKSMGLSSEGDLYAELGYGKVSIRKILRKLIPEEVDLEAQLRKEAGPIQRMFERAAKASRGKMGVKVGGVDDIMVRFAKCCGPLPGDRIVGFVTRGRGVTVHHADCPQVQNLDPARKIDVSWDVEVKSKRKVNLNVHSEDTMGLLANVTRAITQNGANIISAQVKTNQFGKAENAFELTVEDARQLERILRAIEMVNGVIKVERLHSKLESGQARKLLEKKG